MREKKGFLLQTVSQMNTGAIVTGLGFLLYLALSALTLETAADITAVAFGRGVGLCLCLCGRGAVPGRGDSELQPPLGHRCTGPAAGRVRCADHSDVAGDVNGDNAGPHTVSGVVSGSSSMRRFKCRIPRQ